MWTEIVQILWYLSVEYIYQNDEKYESEKNSLQILSNQLAYQETDLRGGGNLGYNKGL